MSTARNPVPLSAGRARERFCLAAESGPNNKQDTRHIQASFLARRFVLAPATAQVIAQLAFATRAQT